MKKIIAILFLAVYLCSLAGNSLFIEYLIQRNDVEAVRRIDNGEYNKGHLVEIKIPLRLPYYSSSLRYERYYGKIDVDGMYYDYVMRKVFNDTVYLLCLPDYTKAELKKAKTFISSIAADAVNSLPLKKSAEPIGKKWASQTEYCQRISKLNFETCLLYWQAWKLTSTVRLSRCFIEPQEKPPRV